MTDNDLNLPTCQLTGTNGNVFAVIANVRRALLDAGQRDRAAEWCAAAMECDSYDAVLQLCFDYVDVN